MAYKHSVFHTSRPPNMGRRTAHNSHSMNTSGFGKGSCTLQHVPENTEMQLKFSSSVVAAPREIFRSEDWNSLEAAVKKLFEGEDLLAKAGELNRLHQNVRNILKSKTGTFLSDYYKQELLSKGMNELTEKLKNVKDL